MVFGLAVLLPMSRWAGDGWLRTTAAVIASSAVYPISWRIAAVSVIRHSAPVMIGSFAAAGFLGSCVLASVFLSGRPRWGRTALTTVILGTAAGGLMGAHLHAAQTLGSGGDVLGLHMVPWQTVAGAALGRGLKARSKPIAGVSHDSAGAARVGGSDAGSDSVGCGGAPEAR